MPDILPTLLNLFLLAFILCSMLAMGFSLTLQQILAPLTNGRLVALALVANFVIVPLIGVLLARLFQLEGGLATGLIITAVVAGAPFLPKLGEVARGDIAFSVGLMVLLMVVTIVFAPLAIPLLIPGATASAWDIARPLIVLMLLPLAAGLFVKARYPQIAGRLQPTFSQAASLSLILLAILALVVNWQTLIAAIGTRAFLAAAVFILLALVVGYFLGGSQPGLRSVMGLGTAQRNLGGALTIAASNFAADPNVTVMVLVVAVIGLAILMLAAGELGKRAGKTAATA
jgi:BASS family bile acid:Na+ symporter